MLRNCNFNKYSMLISKHKKIFCKTLYFSYYGCILSFWFGWKQAIFNIRHCNFYKYVGVCDIVVHNFWSYIRLFYESIIFVVNIKKTHCETFEWNFWGSNFLIFSLYLVIIKTIMMVQSRWIETWKSGNKSNHFRWN